MEPLSGSIWNRPVPFGTSAPHTTTVSSTRRKGANSQHLDAVHILLSHRTKLEVMVSVSEVGGCAILSVLRLFRGRAEVCVVGRRLYTATINIRHQSIFRTILEYRVSQQGLCKSFMDTSCKWYCIHLVMMFRHLFM